MINVEEANKVLKNFDPVERIKWVCSKIPQGIVTTTSGGRTSRILPDIIKKTLNLSIPTIFVDTGHYPDETCRFVDKMQKDGIDIRYHAPQMTPNKMGNVYGKLWEKSGEEFEKFLNIVKHQPLNRAFSELNPNLWIRGIMSFQSSERAKMPILEYKNGLYRLYPIIDWSEDQAIKYLEENKLPINNFHYDITKGSSGKKECRIGEEVGVEK